jgi:ferredoxin
MRGLPGDSESGENPIMPNSGLKGLEEKVLQKDLCTACGACLSLCPYLRSWQGRVVKLHDCGFDEGRCFAYCPRTEVDLDQIHRKVFGAALNLSPLARLPLWMDHPHRFLSRKKRCLPPLGLLLISVISFLMIYRNKLSFVQRIFMLSLFMITSGLMKDGFS